MEDKQLSFALHYRWSRDRDKALELITHLLSGLGPQLGVFGGKMVVNIVAAASPDKADAVMRLLERSGAGSAVFVGDDLNDEPVVARAGVMADGACRARRSHVAGHVLSRQLR